MMNNRIIMTGVWVDDDSGSTISFTQVCERYHIREDVLIELLEQGLLNEIANPVKQLNFNHTMLRRIQAACRLQEDLGVNTAGVILALELRDELEKLRQELRMLRHHVS